MPPSGWVVARRLLPGLDAGDWAPNRSQRDPDGPVREVVYRRQSVFPSSYCFYIRDPDWGPSFIKTVAYAPWPVWICLNGNELRTETTVNGTRDFGVGRLLTDENWTKLVDIAHQINQRLLGHQLDACACAPDATLLRELIAGLDPRLRSRQMTYDLRRLRRKGFIQRIPRIEIARRQPLAIAYHAFERALERKSNKPRSRPKDDSLLSSSTA
jgi:hypothetical protein